MPYRSSIGAIVLAASLCLSIAGARAFDDGKYPDLSGQWTRTGDPRFVPDGQKAPLTPEYQAIFEANLADKAAGGHGTDPSYMCLPPGMPRSMLAYEPMEIVVMPEATYILIDHVHDSRRIFTDGRDWPKDVEPTFAGYAIGQWVDEDGDGRYDALIVETRIMAGPRAYDTTGLPLHRDNQTVVKERISLDKNDPNLLHDEITTIDHALTGPWTVTKSYRRDGNPRPVWREMLCGENNQHVRIGKEAYMLSADGYLMPAKKGQPPPDLRYFNQKRN